ncbi:MAG: hypothetical protein IJK73_04245 [Bacteroidales bacterium]|nr:hypothetical protein [Bacteroidales bacterium]
MKKRYLSPVTNIMEMSDLGSPVLAGSIVQVRMTVDPLEETFYEYDAESDTEKNADYLIKF